MKVVNKKMVEWYNRICGRLKNGWQQYQITSNCPFDTAEYNQELINGMTVKWLRQRMVDMKAWHRSKDCPEYVRSFSKNPKRNGLARRYAGFYKPWYDLHKSMQRFIRALDKLQPDDLIATRAWRAEETSQELRKSWNKMLKALARKGLNFTGAMETDNLRKGSTAIYIMNVIPYDERGAEAKDHLNDPIYIDNCIAKIYNQIDRYGKRYNGLEGKALYARVECDVKRGLQRVIEANKLNLKRLGNWDEQIGRGEKYVSQILATHGFKKFLLESGAVYEVALDQDNYNALLCIKFRFKVKEDKE